MELKSQTDEQGRKYKRVILNNKEMIIRIGLKNEGFKGKFEITHREGKSVYGNQVLFEFLIDKKFQEYLVNSKNDLDYVEIYLTEEEFKNLMKTSAEYFFNKNEEKFNFKEWDKNLCENCGEHIFCNKCNKYVWNKKKV